MFEYFDGHLGLVHVDQDAAYVMDEFGNAQPVPFSLPASYFQDH